MSQKQDLYFQNDGFAILLYSALQMTDKKKKKNRNPELKFKRNKFDPLRSFPASVI